jgi:ADP-ribosylglycohydrolase
MGMSKVQDKYRGCLLGLAAGDAMGLTVDNKSWEQIQESYGPNGLLGYDLQEDYAEITSHTQLAAYLCNALLPDGAMWLPVRGILCAAVPMTVMVVLYRNSTHYQWVINIGRRVIAKKKPAA